MRWRVDTAAMVVRRIYVEADTAEDAERLAQAVFERVERSAILYLKQGGALVAVDFDSHEHVTEPYGGQVYR